jgi:hypothetical protein
MTLFRKLVFIGFVACGVPWAQPQSNPKLPQSASSGQIAPSDSAIPSDSAPQSGLVGVKKNTQNSSSVSNVRSVLAAGSLPGQSQSSCFQPGIGWQRIPQSSDNSMPKTSLVGSSTRTTEVSGSSSVVGQTGPDQCPGIMTNALAHGAAAENIGADKQSQDANSNIRTTNANFGVQNWLNADTLLNPASSSSATRLTMGLGQDLPGSKHFSQGTGPSSSKNSAEELEGHAYISPIKLRKMMRDAPDLETRIRLQRLLQRLNDEQKRKSGSSTDNRLPLKNKTSQAISSNTSTNANSGSHTDQ